MTHVILSGEKGGSMMYDRAEELGKSTVWHGEPLSLALLHSFGPAIWVQDGIKKAEELYLRV